MDILQKVKKLLWKWTNESINKIKVTFFADMFAFHLSQESPLFKIQKTLPNRIDKKGWLCFFTKLIKHVLHFFYWFWDTACLFSWRIIFVAWDDRCWTSGWTVWSARRAHVCSGGGRMLQNLLSGKLDHIRTEPYSL